MAAATAGLITMTGATAPQPAAAETVQPRIEQIAAILQQEGFQAKLVTPEKDPKHRYVRSSSEGLAFNVFLMNCDSRIVEMNCDSIQYYGWWTKGDQPFPLQALNAFNEKFRYAKAYVDKEGDAVIEMDVNLDKGGMSTEQFVDNFGIFLSLYSDFAAAMKDASKPVAQ